MKPTICLSMIVKNESSCIARSLELVKPYIDYWIISDTGSTDNTKEIIKEVMKDLPGELHQHPWEDFATNRNNALNLARNKAEYTLIIDADDGLIVESPNAFNNLNADVYKICFHHGTIRYYRPQLLKNSIKYEYVGVLHEYISIQPGSSHQILDKCYFEYNKFSGARSKSPSKFLEDVKVLEKGLKKEPKNERYMFYLAQSYRDGGELEKSIEWYQKRADAGGWCEEVFISYLNIGRMKEILNKSTEEVEIAYLKAFYACPTRSESLLALSRHFRYRNNFNKAYCYAKEAQKISKPIDALFLEHDCYDWNILDEIGISAFYVNQKEDGKNACEKLLTMNLPENEKQRISSNYKFYL